MHSSCVRSCAAIIGARGHENACSTTLSMKFIIQINVKIPIVVGILTLISLIDKIIQSMQSRIVFFQHF